MRQYTFSHKPVVLLLLAETGRWAGQAEGRFRWDSAGSFQEIKKQVLEKSVHTALVSQVAIIYCLPQPYSQAS